MKKERIKLNYTKEMLKQDALWRNEKEDIAIMEVLHKQIVADAISNGFDGFVYQYLANTEYATEVYKNKAHYLYECDCGSSNIAYFGKCKALIEHIEMLLNKDIDALGDYTNEEILEIDKYN